MSEVIWSAMSNKSLCQVGSCKQTSCVFNSYWNFNVCTRI